MKSVVLGGGTGFIGSTLKNLFESKGYKVAVVSRKAGPNKLTWSGIQSVGLPENVGAVINVAGQNVLDPLKRWTPAFKKAVIESRVESTRILAEAINKATKKPTVFTTISGVGIYKPDENAVYDETSKVGGKFDFISSLAHDWESAAKISSEDVRQVTIRSGVVLGRTGGMIKEIFWPFYLGFGGVIGSGEQPFPWIHLHDLCRLFLFSVENNEVKGVLNGVAPQIITNREFTKSFGRALHRPTLLPLSPAVAKLIFGPERSVMMLEGQKVVPTRVTEEYKFRYLYPNIEDACKEFAHFAYTSPKITY